MVVSAKLFLHTRREKLSGKFPVKIKISYKRQKKLYSIGIDLTTEEYDNLHKSLKLKKEFKTTNYYLNKAETIINSLRDNFSFLKFEKLFFNKDVDITNKDVNIYAALLGYHDQLLNEGRIRSAKPFEFCSNWLLKYSKRKNLSFSEITPEFLRGFDKYMRAAELSPSTISIYIRSIRTIYNQAISRKVVSKDDYPFGRGLYSPPAARNIKKALPIDDIEKIFNYQPLNKQEMWAKEMWMFSYLCNGINFKDIALLKFKNLKDDEIIIQRGKTINTKKDGVLDVKIILTKQTKEIIEHWCNSKRISNNYVFPILDVANDTPLVIYSKVNTEIKNINKYLERIAQSIGLNIKLTTNSARHSYSTVLKRAGVPIEMISENLGHSSLKTTQIYLDSFEKEQQKEVVKFLTAFKTKDDKKNGETPN